MAKKKSSASPSVDYLALIREKFAAIPQTQNDVISFITRENNRRKKDNQPLLDYGRMVDTAAKHFWTAARAISPGLGIDEQVNPGAKSYNNASKFDVRYRIGDAYEALSKTVTDLPGFFRKGSAMVVLMEGLALKKNASHTDTEGTFLGVTQMGAPAFFAAWPKMQEVLAGMAKNLPDGHSYKGVQLAGAKLWENAGAVHVQMAALYSHMLPELKRLDKIGTLTEDQKAALMPVLNIIPAVGRHVMNRMEVPGTKLEDIKLATMSPEIKKMMANNPRVFVKDDFKPDKKLTVLQNRMANLRDNIGDALDAVARNTMRDAYEVIAQTEPHTISSPEMKAAKARIDAARNNRGSLPTEPSVPAAPHATPPQVAAKPDQRPMPASPPQVVAQQQPAEPRQPTRITVTPAPVAAAARQELEPLRQPTRVVINTPARAAEPIPLPRASPLPKTKAPTKVAAAPPPPPPPPQRAPHPAPAQLAARTLDQQAAQLKTTAKQKRPEPLPVREPPGTRVSNRPIPPGSIPGGGVVPVTYQEPPRAAGPLGGDRPVPPGEIPGIRQPMADATPVHANGRNAPPKAPRI
jgi:hypothetical protein